MKSKVLRVLLAAAWFVFAGIIIPGHTRGKIPIAGTTQAEKPDDCCGSKSPTKKSPTNCAICHLAAHLTIAEAFTVHLEPGDFVTLLPLLTADKPALIETRFGFLCTGPPLFL